ncbi:MAG: hypothetical protein ABR589_10535 [Chthoniobacterales bacterium]
MAIFTLRQGDVVARLSQLDYRPNEGFQEANTWYVAEASISADSDTKLTNGPATIEHRGSVFSITVTVLECEVPRDEDEEDPEWPDPACMIEIGYAEGLLKLAQPFACFSRKDAPQSAWSPVFVPVLLTAG